MIEEGIEAIGFPERLPGAAVAYHWGAAQLFARRMFIELRIAQKAAVLPPRQVQAEDLEDLIRELIHGRL